MFHPLNQHLDKSTPVYMVSLVSLVLPDVYAPPRPYSWGVCSRRVYRPRSGQTFGPCRAI